jgi:ABC-type enterochelin transport system substrate-binding protein
MATGAMIYKKLRIVGANMTRSLIISSASLILAACGSNERSFQVDDGEGGRSTVSVKGDGEQVTVKTADGEVVYQQGAQGAQFPDHAPQYPGSKVISFANFAGAEGAMGSNYTQHTNDSVEAVMAFYKQRATAAGLKIMMEQTMADSATIAAGDESADQLGAMITVARDGETTMISITASKVQ